MSKEIIKKIIERGELERETRTQKIIIAERVNKYLLTLSMLWLFLKIVCIKPLFFPQYNKIPDTECITAATKATAEKYFIICPFCQ